MDGWMDDFVLFAIIWFYVDLEKIASAYIIHAHIKTNNVKA